MNREFVRHLLHAHCHPHETALSLISPAPKKRFRSIERKWWVLIVECLPKDPAAPAQEPTGPSGSGRISVEE